MMPSWPYLHTLISHFPIVLTVVGTLALLLALVYPRRGLWLYALGTLTLAGITSYPAWLSGDQAAETVHKASWYIQPGSIHQHAQAADITMWLLLALGLASLVAWASIVRAREAFAPARWLRTVVAVLAMIGLVAVSYTGYRGGQIVVDSPILASPTPPVLSTPATPALAPFTTQPAPQAVPQPGTAAPLGQPMQAPLAPIPQQTAPVTVQPPTPHVSPPATH